MQKECVIELIVDGSFARNQIGVGIVQLYPKGEFTVQSIPVSNHFAPITPEEGSKFAEYMAAIEAVRHQPKGAVILLHSDFRRLVSYINTPEKNFYRFRQRALAPYMIAFDNAAEGKSVTAIWKPDSVQQGLSELYFNIAHNASAAATGSRKILATPCYNGIFSSKHINKTRRELSL